MGASALFCLPAAVFGIHCLRFGLPTEDWLVVALFVVWTAYALFCSTCFHECVHQTLTGRTWFDVGLGRVLGTLMLTPYTVYRESHIRHHAYLNKPHDWELWPYADPGCSTWFRRVFVWVDLACGVLTTPYIYGRIYFDRQSPLRVPAVRRTVLARSVACLVVSWGCIVYGTVAWYELWLPLVLAWVVPWWLAGSFRPAANDRASAAWPATTRCWAPALWWAAVG